MMRTVLLLALVVLAWPSARATHTDKREYVLRKIVKVMPGRYTDLPPIEVKYLTAREAAQYRDSGYRVELNKRVRPFTARVWPSGGVPSKPQWALEAVRSRQANAFPNGDGTGVVICLVDSGVSKNHPAIAGQILSGENFTGGPATDFSDTQGHGTLLAGLMVGKDVGNFRGVAPGAKLLVAKVFDRVGYGDYASVARGVQSCIGRSHIINLSLGSEDESEIMKDILEQAVNGNRISVIAAAGNGSEIAFPARFEEVVAVGAIGPDFDVAIWSARGATLDCVAPGDQIFGPNLMGYGVYSGTSISSAIVSAVEAIRISRKSKDMQLIDLGKPQIEQGYGLVDAELTAK